MRGHFSPNVPIQCGSGQVCPILSSRVVDMRSLCPDSHSGFETSGGLHYRSFRPNFAFLSPQSFAALARSATSLPQSWIAGPTRSMPTARFDSNCRQSLQSEFPHPLQAFPGNVRPGDKISHVNYPPGVKMKVDESQRVALISPHFEARFPSTAINGILVSPLAGKVLKYGCLTSQRPQCVTDCLHTH